MSEAEAADHWPVRARTSAPLVAKLEGAGTEPTEEAVPPTVTVARTLEATAAEAPGAARLVMWPSTMAMSLATIATAAEVKSAVEPSLPLKVMVSAAALPVTRTAARKRSEVPAFRVFAGMV